MGLSITYYSKLAKVDGVDKDVDGNPADYDKFVCFGASMNWSEGLWPGRAAPLDSAATYSWAAADSFRAGSYSGYNAWRRQLKSLASGDGDFAELIDFSDNEGVIGPVVSAKLAADFQRNQARADAYDGEGVAWFKKKYHDWRKAFEAASDAGAVDFH